METPAMNPEGQEQEKEQFVAERKNYIKGLETLLAETASNARPFLGGFRKKLSAEERTEVEQELKGLKDSLEAIQAGGEVKAD